MPQPQVTSTMKWEAFKIERVARLMQGGLSDIQANDIVHKSVLVLGEFVCAELDQIRREVETAQRLAQFS